MVLHAAHAAANGYPAVLLKSPDTDVAVIGCYFAKRIQCPLLMLTGGKPRQRVLNLTLMAESLGNVTNALPGLYAITGCDTTNGFSGKGKTSALKPAASHPVSRILLSPFEAWYLISSCR